MAISHRHLRDLIEQLEDEFSPDDGGYRQLRALTDPVQLAVVSDQICVTGAAIRDNLVEARLHQQHLVDIVGNEGVRYPEKATYMDTLRRGAEMDMAITGCTRALGSALDCLGAVAIGVLRMPFPITRGSFGDIARVVEPKTLATGKPKQQHVWADLHALLERHGNLPPDGWLDWLIGMRNLNVHRARKTHILLQRVRDTGQPQMIAFTAHPEEVAKKTARFDLHLRRRPDLPDMHDLIISPTVTDLWINERATTTLPGVFKGVNDLIEDATRFLADWWQYARKWPNEFPPPVGKWELPSPPFLSFGGVAPSAAPHQLDLGRVSPLLAKRLALAERLRTRKA
jgi:hypothetical protein